MIVDFVNIASRLEGVNKAYGTQIIIEENTYRFAQNAIEVRELVGRSDECTPERGNLPKNESTVRPITLSQSPLQPP